MRPSRPVCSIETMRLAYLAISVLPLVACSLQRSPIIDSDAPPLDDVSLPDGSTCDPTACNDGNPCTDDRCGVSSCEHVPNVAGCDDGLFCTLGERCSEGTCGGGAEMCPFCEEAADSCGACSMASECPAPTTGACTYADGCATTGTSTSTSFRCEAGMCVAETMNTPCSRATDGMMCGDTVVTRGTCMQTGMSCSRGGAVAVTTASYVCGAGTCTTRNTVGSEACDHEPTGDPCRSCTDGLCAVELGFCAGSFTRSCGVGTCAATGVCLSGSTDTTEDVACNAAAGTVCASSGSCGPCMGSGGSGCGRICTYTLGNCAGATCTGAGTPMTGRFDCPCP